MIAFSADLRNLAQRTATWSKAAGVTFAEGLRKQAGLLKQDLWLGAPPKNRTKAQKQAMRDVRQHFRPIPESIFSGAKANGKLRWLYAGKFDGGERALVGVRHDHFQPGMSVQSMIQIRKRLRGQDWGAPYYELGKRGKGEKPFHVMHLDRLVVKKQNLIALLRNVQGRFGIQKASWAADIEKFGGRRPPQWIANHGSAKGQTIPQLTGDRPAVIIKSRARGVEGKSSIANVRRSVRKRMASMKSDMKLYLAGIKKKAGFN